MPRTSVCREGYGTIGFKDPIERVIERIATYVKVKKYMKKNTAEVPAELQMLLNANSSIVDFAMFEDSDTARKKAQKDFINGDTRVPNYQYPKLQNLYDTADKGMPLSEKKTKTYEAVLELEAQKKSGVLPEDLYELYASYHEVRLKKIMLVEAAKRLHDERGSAESVIAREEFNYLNKELYGEMDEKAFSAIMATESKMVEDFEPADKLSARIKSELLDYFRQHKFEGTEKSKFSAKELAKLREAIDRRYSHSLSPIPETPDDKYYTATECATIMTDCLFAGGLADEGWGCEVNPAKSNPTTNSTNKMIYLPTSTRRNAAELRRLYLHEGEVHARRARNGEMTGLVPLENGTANYADVEEGLGVILEIIESGSFSTSPAYARARDRYIMAGLALGTDGVPKDGRAAYEIMWRILALREAVDGKLTEVGIAKAKQQALVHDDNAFRGTNFAMPGVVYSKLKVYYEGLVKNLAYFRQNIDNVDEALDIAMLGKYDHTDQHERRHVRKLVM